MNGWQKIETAPKDGSVVLLRNKLMKNCHVRGRWGDLIGPNGRTYLCWVSEYTPDPNGFNSFPAQRLIIPDEWRPEQNS